MPVHNADIASVFAEIADLLELEGANTFRVRAYRNAALSVSELGGNVQTMVAQGEDLKGIPGVGDDLAEKLREIVATGTCALLQQLRGELPPAITELLQIPGLGPKRVRALYDALNVQSLEQLHRAAEEGRICELPGFGPKTQAQIIENIEARLQKKRASGAPRPRRHLLPDGEGGGRAGLDQFRRPWQVRVCEPALRRRPGPPRLVGKGGRAQHAFTCTIAATARTNAACGRDGVS